MPFVLDTSITAVWALADESSPLADLAAQRLKDEFALVPPIWWYEIRNLLVVSERRQRITADETATFLEILAAYPIQIDSLQEERRTLEFARQYGLSFYDAAYLAVAHRNHAPLATLDKAMEEAASSAGIALLRC
jgi:predicted nucleic acid-binding protein